MNTSCYCETLTIYILSSASEKRVEGVSCALEYQKFRSHSVDVCVGEVQKRLCDKYMSPRSSTSTSKNHLIG
jgi:hypothetical protein